MQKLLSYLRQVLVASCLFCTTLAMAGVTITAQERSLGKVLPGMDAHSLSCSNDGSHVAYVAEQGDKQLVVVDGRPGSTYDMIFWREFSYDSQHVAYEAKQGDKWFIVVDEKLGPAYDGIKPFSQIFSHDSQHVVYTAKQGNKWLVVRDGATRTGI